MKLELASLRVFDVLRNTLTGELGCVMGVQGDRVELRSKDGATTHFKFGGHFERAGDDVAVDFRTALRALRKQQQEASGKKRRKPFTAESFLKKFAKRKK